MLNIMRNLLPGIYIEKRKNHCHKYNMNYIVKRLSAVLAGGALSLSLLLCNILPVNAEQTAEERLEVQRAMPVQSNEIPNWPTGPVVGAESAILIDADTGAILYSKNIHTKEYPASTTKLLTCLIAVERTSMDEVITLSHSAVFDTPRDSSHIAMDVGEEITMEQALNAILIASANEVAFAVAEHISGSWQEFAVLMNEKAKELGCQDSNFVNPNGLPDDNHYSSAYDLAMIARKFFANELLCKISSTTLLHIPPTDKQPDDIIEHSRNQILPGMKNAYEHIVGSKTGYTNTARSCLVSCAEKDGMRLICVVMKDESPMQFEDTRALFDYGFSNFDRVNVSATETKYNIDKAGFFYSDNDIFGSSRPILTLNQEDCIILPKTAAFTDTVSTISYDTNNPGQAAIITYTYNDVYIGSASVDFVTTEEQTYSFDTEPSGEQTSAQDEKPSVIFINIVKVLLWAGGIAALAVILVVGSGIVKNYQLTQRNNRRSWRRSRRKRKGNYLSFSEGPAAKRRESARQARRNRKKAKRPSRFRDYDY